MTENQIWTLVIVAIVLGVVNALRRRDGSSSGAKRGRERRD